MRAKDYLSEIRRIDLLKQNNEREIETISKYDEAIIINYRKNLEKAIESLIAKREEIKETIEKLEEPALINLLYARYFEYKTWEEIAVEMHMCVRQIYRKHGEAISKTQKILENNKQVI